MLRDLNLQRRGYHPLECIQLLQILIITLSEEQILSDLPLQIIWNFHVLHSSVGIINLVLEPRRFLVDLIDQHSHVSEDISVDDGTHDDDE